MKREGDVIDDIAEVIFDYIPEKTRAIGAKIKTLLTGKKEEESPVIKDEYFFRKEMTFDNKVWNLRGRELVGGLSFYLESESESLAISFNNAVHSHQTVQQTIKWPLESEEVNVVFDSGRVQIQLKLISRENKPIMLEAHTTVAKQV